MALTTKPLNTCHVGVFDHPEGVTLLIARFEPFCQFEILITKHEAYEIAELLRRYSE